LAALPYPCFLSVLFVPETGPADRKETTKVYATVTLC
jgi:hypothetical protein